MGNYSPRMGSLQSLIKRENMFNYLANKKDFVFSNGIVSISDSIYIVRKCMSRYDMRINKVVT